MVLNLYICCAIAAWVVSLEDVLIRLLWLGNQKMRGNKVDKLWIIGQDEAFLWHVKF
ncbi:hypothetical protein PMIT1313_01621 [Prochlorococcus marinus str. MIT 1313]|nr:hypothetical protein PMIT1313_01621 [Prochlorococcus marinus str. MIT 1313]KZR71821.1 hypothetical protein PMIT1318_01629 [Prochlorococcus marinus str. MIT 1318]